MKDNRFSGLDLHMIRSERATVGKVSTDRQSKKFSTDDRFLWTVGICALNNLSTAGTEKDPISTEILD